MMLAVRLLFAMIGGGAASPVPPAPPATVILELPRPLETDETAVVRVVAGVLPRGARVVARLPDGTVVGSVTPYGVRHGEKAGAYTIALPPAVLLPGSGVTLHLTVERKGAASRPPTSREVEKVELVVVPVSR